MRVAMICPEFPPNAIGGGGEVFQSLAERLPRFGLQLDVIAGNYRGGGDAARRHDGTRYEEIPLLPTPPAMPYLRTVMPPTASGLRRLHALITPGAYDVAHVHGVSFILIDVAAHLLARAGIPWVFTMHGQPRTPFRHGPILRSAYSAYLRGYGSFVMRRAAVRTAVSAATKTFGPIAGYMCDAHVIPNGVDVEDFSAAMPEEALRGWPQEPVILSIGRLSYAKGFDIGVRALAMMKQRAAYVVLGDDAGELRRCRDLARTLGVADRFFALGPATREQIRFALRRSAAVWVPSRWEAFGVVPLEAMASGVPVIASGAEGLAETFAGIDELLLPSPEDAAALAAKTEMLLADRFERERISMRVRTHVRRFDWNGICEQYVRWYRTATVL
jgi:glycosyltransferase involved in cell wall biosynthesis